MPCLVRGRWPLAILSRPNLLLNICFKVSSPNFYFFELLSTLISSFFSFLIHFFHSLLYLRLGFPKDPADILVHWRNNIEQTGRKARDTCRLRSYVLCRVSQKLFYSGEKKTGGRTQNTKERTSCPPPALRFSRISLRSPDFPWQVIQAQYCFL